MFKPLLTALFVLSCASLAAAQFSSTDSTDWAGLYVGGSVSASSDKADADAHLQINQVTNLNVGGVIIIVPSTTREFVASRRETGWGGGFQAGYQWQGGRFVFGPEADYDPFHRTVNVSQSFQLPQTLLTQPTMVVARRDVRFSGEFSLRARAGVAFGKTLLYGTAGYAQSRVRVSVNDSFANPGGMPPVCSGAAPPSACSAGINLGPSGPVVTTASESQNMGGWAGGVGVERRLGARWSVGFEYRHTDLRDKTFALGNQTTVNTGPEARGTNGSAGLPGGVVPGPTRLSLRSDSFGVRLNFHF